MRNWKRNRRVFTYGLVEIVNGFLKVITLGFYNPSLTWKLAIWGAKRDARKAQRD